MSAPTPTQNQPTRSANANRGRKNRGGRPKGQRETDASKATLASAPVMNGGQNVPAPDSEDGSAVCWICAESVKYYSLSECNHRTCHVCALRLRALYKRMDCTFCKHPQATLIFTLSPDDLFESYTPESIPFKDTKLSISFETQDMMEETLILLRFNCPDPACDFIAHGWGDLKMHVRAVHGKSMCDMCIRYKKVFAHEHVLYQPSQLPFHLPSIPYRPSHKNQAPEKVEGGVHPMCEFCRECHFGDDELFAHMRERHEECFVCKRSGIRDQYFLNYDGLERHFNSAHFPCKDSQCQIQKFVVFGSALDLKAHMVEQHGGEMTSRGKKDARRIETGFDYDDAAGNGGANRRQGTRNRATEREREREPPDPGLSRNRRREGFGATLTTEPPRTTPSPQPPPPRPRDDDQSSSLVEVDPVAAERHTAFIARVNFLTSNSTAAVPAIKSAVRSYRSSESGPRDLISTFFNVVNRDLDATASLISALVELLDDEDKRRALLTAWNGFKLEQQRQFPDLTPSAPGTEYAGVTGGRVLNVKHSAAVRSSSSQSPGQVWDRVAQAAASSSSPPPGPVVRPHDRFPSLAASRTTPAFRQSQHNTAWSAAGASSSSPSSRPAPITTAQRTAATPGRSTAPAPRAAPPKMSASLFPTLPSSGVNNNQTRPHVSGNQSLKHILGELNAPPSNPWGGKTGDECIDTPGSSTAEGDADSLPDGGAAKGKRKKGKEKQTLFTFGTFPT